MFLDNVAFLVDDQNPAFYIGCTAVRDNRAVHYVKEIPYSAE